MNNNQSKFGSLKLCHKTSNLLPVPYYAKPGKKDVAILRVK